MSKNFEEDREKILAKLKDLGVNRVVVEYNGSGDSGDIHGISAFGKSKKPKAKAKAAQDEDHAPIKSTPASEVDIKNEMIEVMVEEGVWDRASQKVNETAELKSIKLYDAVERLACATLERNGIDWYNNEGGFGNIIIDIKTGKIKTEHNARIESSEYEEHEL
jgi:hypothetical protein